jgi:hypothetical protein
MSEVPEVLLPKILDLARRHHRSHGNGTDDQEAAIIRGILDWGKTRSAAKRIQGRVE